MEINKRRVRNEPFGGVALSHRWHKKKKNNNQREEKRSNKNNR